MKLHAVFSMRLRAARKASGLSQGKLAVQIGARTSDISRYESGQHLPSWARTIALAEALGVEVYQLLMPHEQARAQNVDGLRSAIEALRTHREIGSRTKLEFAINILEAL